jgi:cysteine dioxygenase
MPPIRSTESLDTSGCSDRLPPEPARLSVEEIIAALDAAEGLPPHGRVESLLRSVDPSDPVIHAHARFSSEKYQRHLVVRRAHYEMLVMCWLPGQRSLIHDHHGSHCGVAVLAGEASELRFERLPDGRLRPSSVELLPAGGVTASIDDDIHVVGNWAASGEPLMTLHVYSPPLTDMRTYDERLVDTDELERLSFLPDQFRLASAALPLAQGHS